VAEGGRVTEPLLRLGLDPDVEVNALAVDHVLTLANVGPRDDPVTQHDVTLERNVARELNAHRSVREVETGVVPGSHHESSSTVRRG
jgi:hypothetical protein